MFQTTNQIWIIWAAIWLPSMLLFSRATSLKSSECFWILWKILDFSTCFYHDLCVSTRKGRQNHPGSPLVGSPTSWYCWSPQSLVPCPQWSPTQWPAVFFLSMIRWSAMTGAKHQGRLAMMVGSLFRDIAHQLCHLKSKKVNGDGNSLSMEKHLLKLWSPKYTNALII